MLNSQKINYKIANLTESLRTHLRKNSCERKMDITDQYIHAQL
jgi:hypothetical protein